MPVQKIFQHNVPIGLTNLTHGELRSFDKVLADLIYKQNREEEREQKESMVKTVKKNEQHENND